MVHHPRRVWEAWLRFLRDEGDAEADIGAFVPTGCSAPPELAPCQAFVARPASSKTPKPHRFVEPATQASSHCVSVGSE